jgi:hypothetical protein
MVDKFHDHTNKHHTDLAFPLMDPSRLVVITWWVVEKYRGAPVVLKLPAQDGRVYRNIYPDQKRHR